MSNDQIELPLRSFGSDNHATVHPEIMKMILAVNEHQVPSYGTDPWSHQADKIFKSEFGPKSESYLLFNGTATNVLALRSLVKNYESVFCSDISHINQDECGAPEKFGGVKLIPVPSKNGKIYCEELEKLWVRRGDQHYCQTQGLSLTQPTEVGTVYSMEELKELIQWAKQKKLKIHIDGARLANAAVALNKSFCDFTTNLGVDVISFGGSKNGLMLGEALVFANSELSQGFKYIRKQSLQLPSKSRYIAAQFLAYFSNNLWERNAKHSISMAQNLLERINKVPSIDLAYPVQSNALFPRLPKSWIKPLREKYFFYVWDEKTTTCRWMTSWDTTLDDVDGFSNEIIKVNKNHLPD